MKSTQCVEETKSNFMKWWHGEDIGRPLINLSSGKGVSRTPPEPADNRSKNLDALTVYENAKRTYSTSTLYGDTLPFVGLSIGVGCMAAYLGCEPIFADDTTWMRPIVDEGVGISSLGELRYDENNYWWKEHLCQLAKLARLSCEDGFILTIPDILENLDVLILLCGSQNVCCYLVEEPEQVKEYIKQVDDLYFKYYDEIYDLIKGSNGESGALFNIWSDKRTLKIQCDTAALISPSHFEEFVMPSFEKQLERIDYSLYHLDGPDAIRTLDSVLSLKNLKALQFTPGDGKPPPEDESWYFIYDKVRKAGKSLWIYLTGDDPLGASRRLVERYGTAGLYLLYQDQDEDFAKKLFDAACNGFR